MQVGFDIFYWVCREEDDFNIFELRKIDIRTKMEEEVVKTFKCQKNTDEKNKNYYVLGVIMNNHFTSFNKKHEGINESRLPDKLIMEDYYLTIVYSNSESPDEAKIEFR